MADMRGMTVRRRAVTVLVAVLALTGCDSIADEQPAPAPPATAPAPSPAPVQPSPSAAASPEPAPDADGRTVSGTLDGDAQLEGGCVWISTADGNIEPLLPDGYTTTTDPVALLGPDGDVIAEAGDQVTIVGNPAPDIMTICQVGAVWRVAAVEAADG